MDTNKLIGIIVALPEERIALVKKLQQVKRRLMGEIPVYSGLLEGRSISVIEGGMGTVAAAFAAKGFINELRPNLLISAGFCGAVRQGAKVADLVLCKRLFAFDIGGLHEVRLPGSELITGRLSAELQSKGLRTWQGSFITTTQIVTKIEMAATIPDDLPTPVLEMESAAVAQVATAAGVAFMGLRVISDAAEEELNFTLDELTDPQLRISIPRVLLTCLKKPRIIPQLARLAANSGRAGKNLGLALQQIIRLL